MEFKEDFLQAVWKYQYFDRHSLTTTDGQLLEIRKIGYHNQHEGPDFLEAHVKIGKVDHHGHIEIHKDSSAWNTHGHTRDSRYAPVILHVVWNHDRDIHRPDGMSIPTLELQGRIFLDVIRNYQRLTEGREEILCSPTIEQVPEIVRYSMLEKALVERLEGKSSKLNSILLATKNDWEETAFRWIFYCFGFKTNAQTMLRLAEKLPYRQLLKLSHNGQTIRAILLGMAGLIPENPPDEESLQLQNEFVFQQQKLKLATPLHRNDWKFLGVRPPNFPSIRLAQLAEFLGQNQGIFSSILHMVSNFSDLGKLMEIRLPVYWQHHYQLGQASQKKQALGFAKSTIHLLSINFVVPLWYEYGKFRQENEWKEKCVDFLQTLPGEDNHIIRKFKWMHAPKKTAFDSQALIGLFQDYCQPKKCLQCKIGQSLLKPEKK